MQDVNVNFLDIEAQNLNIHPNSLAYQYLVKKTKASDRGSKARRSLGNLYALYVLCEDYINDTDGSTFSNLMLRMKSLPFGSKLQNHQYRGYPDIYRYSAAGARHCHHYMW